MGSLGHPWGSFGIPGRPFGPLWDAFGRLLEDFAEVGGHSENRCPSRAKTYFLRVRGASGAPNDGLEALLGPPWDPWGTLLGYLCLTLVPT